MQAVMWSTSFKTLLTLPSEPSGPSSVVLKQSFSRCNGVPSNALIGPGGCISAALRRSLVSNRTTVMIELYGNASAAPDCATFLEGMPSPAWVAVQLAGPPAVEAVTTAGYIPAAAFPYDSALVVPFRVANNTMFTFALSTLGVAAVNDICRQRLLTGQLPDTCVVHLLYESKCISGLASELSGSSAGGGAGGGQGGDSTATVGGAPVIQPWTSPPLPSPSNPQDGGGDMTMGTRDRGGKLSNGQIALIVCLVVSAVLLAFIFFALFWHRRSKFNVARGIEAEAYGQTVTYNVLAAAETATVLQSPGPFGGSGVDGGAQQARPPGRIGFSRLLPLRGRGAVSESRLGPPTLLQPPPLPPPFLPPRVAGQHEQQEETRTVLDRFLEDSLQPSSPRSACQTVKPGLLPLSDASGSAARSGSAAWAFVPTTN
ncbi:hypothetical protein Vretifemale_16573 [Volvox reticuliferus]|uniref:Uncharacterized protein n=2 Tax=Volvox reticuliferus TaxID=1737510 RepID=A0A8J4CU55_9CHLO|nr:hypothetical protein Vretifemale_16573 [Volvox reticuliferus]